jgi:outer membrane protein OmpA-like peptidoglycan-associated protein
MGICVSANAQLLKNIKNKVVAKSEQKADAEVDRKIDKEIDGALDDNGGTPDQAATKEKTAAKQQPKGMEGTAAESNKESKNTTAYTSKFDFVPGDAVVYLEDFAEDALGDFPAKWNTNGSGEIVTLYGLDGKWLLLQPQSNFTFNQLLALPENCTIQFDVMLSLPFEWASNPLNFAFGDIKNPDTFLNTEHYSLNDNRNVTFWLNIHPGSAASNSNGYGGYLMNNTATSNLVNEKLDLKNYFVDQLDKLPLKVSIWRQNQRLRVYLNENKVLDLPRILPQGMNINTLVWQTQLLQGDNHYFIGNIRISTGAPDMRNKLLTEGKLVSNGILFGVNSDVIKPESFGIFKEIATVLKENPNINLQIVGHTDSDGDEAANLALSKKRAMAVKNALATDFKIDADRMQIDGKGETEPLAPNTTAINKANNRRVEFIKID